MPGWVWIVALAVTLPPAGESRVADVAQPARLDAAVVIDDLHIDFVATGRLRTAVRTLVAPFHRSGQLARIQTTGPSNVRLDVDAATASRRIDESITRIAGHALRADDVSELVAGGSWQEVRDRAWQVATTIDAVISTTGGTEQRVVVLLSLGYRTDDADVDRAVSHIVARASAAGVAIVALDPDWFDLGDRQGRLSDAAWRHHREWSRASLIRMATDSGGTIWGRDEDAAAVLARLR